MSLDEKGESPKNYVVLKQISLESYWQQWHSDTWSEPPSKIVTVLFPGGVLVGFVSSDKTERQAFLLAPEDAKIIGQRLLAKAAESEAMEETQ